MTEHDDHVERGRVQSMAADIVAFIGAFGHRQIALLGPEAAMACLAT
ncbi:hypothetical protein OHO28_09485 [Streptomyces europaeiscabiei]